MTVVARPEATVPPGGSQVFTTADPFQAHTYICSTYTKTAMQPIGDQTSLRMLDTRRDLGSMVVADFTHSAGLEQLAEPLGRLMVVRVVEGEMQCDTIGETRRLRQGDLFVVAQPDRPFLVRWETPIRIQAYSFDPSVLLDVAAAPDDLVPRFTALTPASAGGKQLVATVLDYLVHDVVDNPDALASPLIRQRSVRALAAALLETFPNTASRDPVVSDRIEAAHSRVLRTAVAYVHDHAHEDISVRTLAEAAGASRQAVHLAFSQHLQTTPRAYLERVRLDRVHRDLADLDPSTTTVDQLALLWGFLDLERFRRDYEHTFNTCPEQTLWS